MTVISLDERKDEIRRNTVEIINRLKNMAEMNNEPTWGNIWPKATRQPRIIR